MNIRFRNPLALVVGTLTLLGSALAFWGAFAWVGARTGVLAACATAPFAWVLAYIITGLAGLLVVPLICLRLTQWAVRRVAVRGM